MKFSVLACLPLKVIGFSYLMVTVYVTYGYIAYYYVAYYYTPEEPASVTSYYVVYY